MFAAHAAPRRPRHDDAVAVARRPVTLAGLVAIFILIIFVATPESRPQQGPAYGPGVRVAAAPAPTEIALLVGRSTVLNVDRPIERVSLTTPEIADAVVTAPQQILIHGKTPGTISLFVWDRAGGIKAFEVHVRRDLSALAEQVRQLFPGESIAVAGNGRDVVLSGTVSSKYVVEKAADVAAGYVEKKENVVNLLRQQEGVASNQVMLRVRFAEVSRSALTELGASFFTGAGGFQDYVSRVTTQQFPAPNFDEMTRGSIQGPDNWGGGRDTVVSTGGKQTFSDFLNLFIFNNRYSLGTVIRVLQEKGLFQSLAEPNLIATNGKEASFLAGGEYPYPVVQGTGGGALAVTIQFKEFGIRLSFTPTVLGGDLINLKVRPEVSALDFNSAVVVQGFRIPALSTRRTETEVELQDGQTFAIAGLLNNTVTDSMRKIPGIGDIPILGWLFKSRAMQKNQTELVVMITPQILKRGSTGVTSSLPNMVTPFLAPRKKTVPPPAPYAPKDEAGSTPPAPPTASATPAPGATQPAAPAPALTEAEQKAEATLAAGEVKASANELKRAAEEVRRAQEQAEKERKEQEKLARALEEQQQEAAKRAAKDAEKQREAQEKLAREQARRDADAQKRAAELAKKQQKEEQERAKALADAEARLRAAQAAYQAELKKHTKPGGDTSGKPPEQK